MSSATGAAPAGAWVASWIFWLCLFAIALGAAGRTIERHRADHRVGERNWQMRVEMCKRLSAHPRPPWQECHERAKSHELNLLSAREAPAVTR